MYISYSYFNAIYVYTIEMYPYIYIYIDSIQIYAYIVCVDGMCVYICDILYLRMNAEMSMSTQLA